MVRSSKVIHVQANADVHDFTIGNTDMVLMDSWNEEAKGAIG